MTLILHQSQGLKLFYLQPEMRWDETSQQDLINTVNDNAPFTDLNIQKQILWFCFVYCFVSAAAVVKWCCSTSQVPLYSMSAPPDIFTSTTMTISARNCLLAQEEVIKHHWTMSHLRRLRPTRTPVDLSCGLSLCDLAKESEIALFIATKPLPEPLLPPRYVLILETIFRLLARTRIWRADQMLMWTDTNTDWEVLFLVGV